MPLSQVLPACFRRWVQDNETRIAAARSLPYFIQDNMQYVEAAGTIAGAGAGGRLKSWLRHLTLSEDAAAEQAATAFTATQIENHRAVSRALGIEQGERMTFKDADSGKTNPRFSWIAQLLNIKNSYNTNCTLTVVTHELRMRGFDVTALPFDANNAVLRKMSRGNPNLLWIDPETGKPPVPAIVRARTLDKTMQRFGEQTATVGRYHVAVSWKNGGAHIFCVDRLPNGETRIYDPQSNELNIRNWSRDINLKKGIKITKVDRLIINASIIANVAKKR